nr:hypothetical protein Iba_chr12fCG10780 [Ipomoea batatas]
MIFQQQRFPFEVGLRSTRWHHWWLSDEFQHSDEKLRQQWKHPVALLCSNLTVEEEDFRQQRDLCTPSRNPCSGSINNTALRWLFYLVDFPLLFFEAFEGEKRATVEFEASSTTSKVELGRYTARIMGEMVTLSLTLAGVKVHVHTYDVLDFDLDLKWIRRSDGFGLME